MAKSKADSNKEFKAKVKESGGKRITVVLTAYEADRLDSFMKLHKIHTYREFIRFCTDYKLVQFNSVQEVPMDSKGNHSTFIKDCKRYQLLGEIVYGTMNSNVDTGEIFPF